MNLKKHTPTPHYLMIENLLRRLPQHHNKHSKLKERLGREKAGSQGEQRLDYSLSKLDFNHFTLHDIRLPFNRTFFQMDTLLVTPRYLLVIEVKAYRGQILFRNDFQQTIQQRDSNQKIYDDPILQVEEQKFQLSTWLEHQRIQPLPVETLVVMTHPHVILNATDQHEYYQNRVIPLSKLSSKLREINKKYQREYINSRESRSLAKKIANAHTPYAPNILDQWKIEADDILTGVCCPNCQQLPMQRVKRRWECVRCGHRSLDAHISALKDYFLLGNKSITNSEFRRFTGLESESSARYMLSAILEGSGNTSSKQYRLDFDYLKDFNSLNKK